MTGLEDLPPILTVEELAKFLRTGRTATYEWVKREGLAIHCGRKLRIPRERIERLLEGPTK